MSRDLLNRPTLVTTNFDTLFERADEALVMGLRLSEGIDARATAQRLGLPDIVDWAAVDRLSRTGHLTRSGTTIAATPQGRLLLDRLLAEIACVYEPPESIASTRL